MRVPMRSGSPTNGSAPAARMASTPGPSVVPRTAWPACTSVAASARPRHPHGTIRTRATLGAVLAPVARWPHGELGGVAPHAPLVVVLVALGQAALAPQHVLRADHLRDVVDVVLRLQLGRAGRLPLEDVERRALR